MVIVEDLGLGSGRVKVEESSKSGLGRFYYYLFMVVITGGRYWWCERMREKNYCWVYGEEREKLLQVYERRERRIIKERKIKRKKGIELWEKK